MANVDHTAPEATIEREIKQTAENQWVNLSVLVDEAENAYWAFHSEIQRTVFSHKSESMKAVRKLGQLGEALNAMNEALRSVNAARCN
jgi:hypothetical protein